MENKETVEERFIKYWNEKNNDGTRYILGKDAYKFTMQELSRQKAELCVQIENLQRYYPNGSGGMNESDKTIFIDVREVLALIRT